MRKISHEELWSHESKRTGRKYCADQVRASQPLSVSSFDDLVREVAIVSFRNPKLNLFFRGQDGDHLNKDKLTKIQPSLYRGLPGKQAADPAIATLFRTLDHAAGLLTQQFRQQQLFGSREVDHYPELAWAVLQHYGVCSTPLLDITLSLRAACSFAFLSNSDSAILYMLGFPGTHGTMSYHVADELVNIKLQGACPPDAIRPYFQDGVLVGSIPWVKNHERAVQVDAGRRLVAKFRLVKSGFWSSGGGPIPCSELFPKNDPILSVCEGVKKQLSESNS